MEEKKLTDEEIVKALGNCENLVACEGCLLKPQGCIGLALDLIHRLQDDYSKLKERYVKVLDLNEKVIADKSAEIERLNGCILEYAENLGNEQRKSAELQKQVDKAWIEVGKMCMEERKDTANEVYQGLCIYKNFCKMKDAILWGNESEELKDLISKIVGVEVE